MRERGTCTPYEKEYLLRDGTRVSVFLADTMLPGPGEQIAAFVLDITAPKQAEEALRQSEECFRLLFQNLTSGFALHEIICDVQGQPCDYRFRGSTPRLKRSPV